MNFRLNFLNPTQCVTAGYLTERQGRRGEMTEEEIDLAMKMLMYSAIGSEQEVKNATPIELILQLQYFSLKRCWKKQLKD